MNERKSNTLSILSLIFGIVGLLLSCIFIGIIPCIAALILGIIAIPKNQSKGMAIGGIVCSAVGILIFIVMLFAASSSDDNESRVEVNGEPTVLTGNWEEKDKGDTYHAGYISGDTIEIFWMSDGGNSASLYWSGSYISPTEPNNSYSWDSVNNKEKTNYALLASGDETKTFTYSDGKLTYEASALGATRKVTLVPSDTDYSVFGDDSGSVSETTGSDTDTGISMGNDASTSDLQAVSIEEKVIYESNDVVITVKGMERAGNDFEVKLLIENNSSLNLGFNAHAYGVNGIMTGNNIYSMNCDVAAGKKANTSFDIDSSFLSENDIDEIRYIDILFWAYDNDKMFKEFDTGQLRIETSLYNETSDISNGTPIFEQDGLSVSFISRENDNFTFLLINDTEDYINFDFTEISINDYTVSDVDYDLYDEIVLSKNAAICTISVKDEFMQENDIDTVESIEWNITCRPYGDYFEEYKIGTVSYTVE